MKIESRILMRIALAACVACALVSAAAARTVKQKKQAARTQFETAERLREALDGRPESQRTRRDYLKVMDAYRKVYYTAPTSSKADAAVLAVAELLDEQGRVLNDPKSYKDAIGQLVFLRREYPGSKYRVEALFAIGEIFRDDLNDNAEAKATFEDYLKHYPNSRLAPQAKQALAEIADAENPSRTKKRSAKLRAQGRSSPARAAKTKAAWTEMNPTPAPPAEEKAAGEKPSPTAHDRDARPDGVVAANAVEPPQEVSLNQTPRRMARLTSIRHWSTPDYTRVAIDLEQEVEYQAGRVPHPDRIFFDLVGTKLAPDLLGKSFDVEAGFLHRIRVAQYKASVARVVLDVDDVAEYSAFLLPNPYRLIIDIHGKLPARQVAAVKTNVTMPAPPSAAVKEKKAGAADSEVTVRQIKPATNTKPVETAAQPAVEKSKPAAVAAQEAKPAQQAPAQSAASRSGVEQAAATLSSKDSPDKVLSSKDKSSASGEKTVEVAKADPPKTVVDDTVMDEPTKVTTKPTTGPTFQSIAPQESSRNRRKPSEPVSKASNTTTHVASPTAAGKRSLIRALGLKIGKIVVDAGHGGHDTGTIGPNGLMEKDLVLDVALKLGKLLETKLGAEVVYTRDDDTFIPLETRTAIANKEQADMFISIHANSSSDTSARGVETYYLNFTTSRDALEVAARENAVSEKSIHELQDLVKKIALKEKIEESREFAADVQHSLYVGLNSRNPGVRNRGVKKAPFVVLIGANMPSILAEISFVSNAGDEKKLKTSEYRQRIADSLYKGINKYVSGLSGVKVASKLQEDQPANGTSAVAAK